MRENLEKVINNAYSPYYKFKVAAALVTNDGKVFYGVNVETASPAAGICAERNAIYSAVTYGYKKGDFKELHVLLESGSGTPCFICRQALTEFFEDDTLVYCYGEEDKTYTIKELCPYPFSEDDLK